MCEFIIAWLLYTPHGFLPSEEAVLWANDEPVAMAEWGNLVAYNCFCYGEGRRSGPFVLRVWVHWIGLGWIELFGGTKLLNS